MSVLWQIDTNCGLVQTFLKMNIERYRWLNWTVASRKRKRCALVFLGCNNRTPGNQMKKIVLASACILPAFTCRRADHQALGWRVEPRQCWTGASQGAIKEGTGTMNRGPLARAADPHPAVTPALLAQTPQPASITRAPPRNPGPG